MHRSHALRVATLLAALLVLAQPGRAQETTGQPPGAADPGLRADLDVPLATPVPAELDGVPYRWLDTERARIYFADEDARVAERVGQLLDVQRPLPGLPDSVPSGVHAVLAHTPAAFDEITGGVVPEWRAGVAIPSLNMLVMPAGEGVPVFEGDGLRTLRHEWAHLGLHARLGDLRVPRWFNEGYAQWASGGFDATEAWRLRVMIATFNDRASSAGS